MATLLFRKKKEQTRKPEIFKSYLTQIAWLRKALILSSILNIGLITTFCVILLK